MRRCAVTGSFDPITRGHIDIINRAKGIYDEVYVVVLNNEKKHYMFDLSEREYITRRTLEDMDNINVMSYEGYVIDFCREHDIHTVVRGFRNDTDFEYERVMSNWNKEHGGVETLLIAQDNTEHLDISSTLARENIDNDEVLTKYLIDKTISVIKEITRDGK